MLIISSAGYPLITYFTKHSLATFGGFNIGGINATGQVSVASKDLHRTY
jgi:hypothetical protein